MCEYWIVEPEERVIEVYVLHEGAYTLLERGGAGETAHSKLLKNFKVGVDDVLGNK